MACCWLSAHSQLVFLNFERIFSKFDLTQIRFRLCQGLALARQHGLSSLQLIFGSVVGLLAQIFRIKQVLPPPQFFVGKGYV